MTTLRRFGLLLALVLAPFACAGGGGESATGDAATTAVSRPTTEQATKRETRRPEPLRRLRAVVVATYPHDTGAYTQGLLLDAGGSLLESSGRYGVSDLRRVDLESGEVMRRVPLPENIFAEGLARLPAAGGRPERLVQISWREGIALVWDAASFERLGEHRYQGEGWGLCHDAAGGRLVMSDGSSWLTFRDAESFSETGGVEAKLEGRPIGNLNELECVDGRVWANVYGSPSLVEIDLADGRVLATVDASGLLSAAEQQNVDVLNGIAHDPADGTFLLTGKLWPKLFRVRFEPLDGDHRGTENR